MKLSNIIAYLISFICIYSCMNSEQVHITLAPEAKDKLQYWKDDDKGVPEVDSFELKNGIATVKGRNLRDVRRAQIVGPSLNTDFTILEQDHDYLTLTGRNSLQIVAEYTYNLILSNAFGQGSTPILFTIEDESIRNRMFPDGEIAGSKIEDSSISLSKIDYRDGTIGQNYVIKWIDNRWTAALDAGADVTGTGTVTSIVRGEGIVGEGNIISSTGRIDVNVGVDANQIVQLDSSGNFVFPNIIQLNDDGNDLGELWFTTVDSPNIFSMYNDGSLRFASSTQELLILDNNGDFFIRRDLQVLGNTTMTGSLTSQGAAVCLSGGSDVGCREDTQNVGDVVIVADTDQVGGDDISFKIGDPNGTAVMTITNSGDLQLGSSLGSFTGLDFTIGNNSANPVNFALGEDSNNRSNVTWNSTNNYLSFGTRASSTSYDETMVIRDGRVGVGENNPGSKLEVQANSTSAANSALNITDSGSSSLLFVRDDGNVGIGTNAPSATLAVQVNENATNSAVITNSNNGTSAAASLGLTADSSLSGTLLQASSTYNSLTGLPNNGAGMLVLNAGVTSNGIGIRSSGSDPIVLTGGNVGIGTTATDRALVVGGIIKSATSTGGRLELQDIGNVTFDIDLADGGNRMDFRRNSAPVMSVAASSVGIGTTNPSAGLHTRGGSLSVALAGTVTVGAGTSTVTGSGTAFTTALEVGDAVQIGSEVFSVASITSATALQLDSNHAAGASGVTMFSDTDLLKVEDSDGNERFKVSKSGIVTAKEFVSGQITTAGDITINADNNTSGSGEIKFSIGNSSPLVLDNGGNLALGNDIDLGSLTGTSLSIGNTTNQQATVALGSNSNNLATMTMNATAGTLSFSTRASGTTFSDTLVITGGRVGIGTTAPTSRLEIEGNSTSANESALHITDSDSNTIMLVQNDGNIGIGTTSPAAALDVQGGNIQTSGNLLTPGLNIGTALNGVGLIEQATSTTKVGLRTGGSGDPDLILDANGLVGVGTTAPSSKLTVAGATSDANGSTLSLIDSSSSSMLFVRNDGQIGIGTTAPDARIDVRETIEATSGTQTLAYFFATPNFTTAGPTNVIGVRAYASNATVSNGVTNTGGITALDVNSATSIIGTGALTDTYGTMITYGSNDASAGSITNATGLYVRPYHRGSTTINNSYAVRIVSPLTGATVTNQWGVYQDSTGMSNYFAGNVGVGTTAPDSKLQVEGTSSDASSAAIGATDSDGNTLLLVRNDGNVGIGTTAPDYKLQVLGGANFDNDGGTTSIVVGTGTNDEGATITFDDTNKYLGLSINGDSSNSFVVANGGNIGIGTTVPQSNLQVSGYIQLDLTSGAPPAADCDEASERGRMQVDNVNSVLYICVNSGWIAK